MIKSRTCLIRRGKEAVYLLVIACLAIFPSVDAIADEPVAVIVNAKNPAQTLSLEEIHNFYENHAVTWSDGKRVMLYELKVKDKAREKFSQVVLGKAAGRVAMEWANKKITNQAKNPPKTVTSAVVLQQRVAQDEYAIGYLFLSEVTSQKVRIVATVE